MAGLLNIVATPIGNLGDLSPRACETLKQSDFIFAESSNHSRPLLLSIGVNLKTTKLIDCPALKEHLKVPLLLGLLRGNKQISLISDAGAPGISDPGSKLIQATIQHDFPIQIIPGPSAVIAALMGSGLITHRFAFLGFLPKTGKERKNLITQSIGANLALVIFESPNRIDKTLEELFKLLGPQNILIARELTKQFETFHRGVLGNTLSPPIVKKGEMVLIIESTHPIPQSPSNLSKSSQGKLVGHKALAKKIALQEGISVKSAYEALLKGAKLLQ